MQYASGSIPFIGVWIVYKMRNGGVAIKCYGQYWTGNSRSIYLKFMVGMVNDMAKHHDSVSEGSIIC